MVTKKNATKKKAIKRERGGAGLSEPNRLASLLAPIADLDGSMDADADD